jgi:hypothetical protein
LTSYCIQGLYGIGYRLTAFDVSSQREKACQTFYSMGMVLLSSRRSPHGAYSLSQVATFSSSFRCIHRATFSHFIMVRTQEVCCGWAFPQLSYLRFRITTRACWRMTYLLKSSPQISFAISTSCRTFAHCSSSVSSLPSTVELKPHWWLRQS